MMKVLHVAIVSPTYKSDGMGKGFVDNGYEYISFDWQYYKFNIGLKGMQDELLKTAKKEQPDLIFLHLQSQGAVTVEMVKELSEIGKVVNYTFDVRSSITGGLRWYKEIAPHIHLTCFACQEDVDECISEGIENVCVMQSAVDIDYYRPINLSTPQPCPEIIFIGGKYDTTNLGFELSLHRQEMIQFLKTEFGDNFCSYGMGQEQSRYVHQHEELLLYNNAKIVIVQNNFDRMLYQSDRIWRAMASGAFVLAHKTKGIEEMFHRKGEIDWWENFDELKEKINYYLRNEDERQQIADMGCTFVREMDNWTARFEELKKHL